MCRNYADDGKIVIEETVSKEDNELLFRVPMIHGFVVMAHVPFYPNGKLSRAVFEGNFADMSKRACDRMIFPKNCGRIWPIVDPAVTDEIAQ